MPVPMMAMSVCEGGLGTDVGRVEGGVVDIQYDTVACFGSLGRGHGTGRTESMPWVEVSTYSSLANGEEVMMVAL